MARLHEYQGKQILKEVGVPAPEGDVASTPQEAREIAERIGKPVAVKAQIWATGRFKADGMKFADDPDGAEKAAGELLGGEVKGFPVEKVLVEEKLDVEHEYCAGVIIDDSCFSREGAELFYARSHIAAAARAAEIQAIDTPWIDVADREGLVGWQDD